MFFFVDFVSLPGDTSHSTGNSYFVFVEFTLLLVGASCARQSRLFARHIHESD